MSDEILNLKRQLNTIIEYSWEQAIIRVTAETKGQQREEFLQTMIRIISTLSAVMLMTTGLFISMYGFQLIGPKLKVILIILGTLFITWSVLENELDARFAKLSCIGITSNLIYYGAYLTDPNAESLSQYLGMSYLMLMMFGMVILNKVKEAFRKRKNKPDLELHTRGIKWDTIAIILFTVFSTYWKIIQTFVPSLSGQLNYFWNLLLSWIWEWIS